VDFDSDAELALKTVAKLKQLFIRRISIIAVGSQLDNGLMLRVMRAGCNEYLTTPIDNAELSASLLRFQSETLIDSQVVTSRGRIVVCVGAKGGVGATTLAVHLGMQLVKQYHQTTLLIDHKHELGHVALYLGLKDGQYHFDDLVRNAERLDRDLLNGFVMRHASGLEIIASPDICAPPHQTTPDQLPRILAFLRHEYDYVLIDSSIAYDDLKQCLIEEADDIFIVSTSDVAALRDLTRQLEYLGISDAGKTKVKVVINRSIKDDDLSAHQIETAVGLPVAVVIPDNYQELVRAINHGEPISGQHRSAFSRQISRLSSDLMKDSARLDDTEPKKKGFAFWR
jgi:pilus assembly protein CpaE